MHHFDLRRAIAAALCWLLLSSGAGAAELIPGGNAIGIEARTDGVVITDVTEVQTQDGSCAPARDAGLRAGDIITRIDGKDTATQAELLDALAHSSGTVSVTYLRSGSEKTCSVSPADDADGTRRLGLWLRDGVSGIGTVTYYDPQTGAFGALGHGMTEETSGVLLPIAGGTIHAAEISSVTQAEPDAAGALQGVFDVNAPVGAVAENSVFGIFGTCDAPPDDAAIETAADSEVTTGDAVIRCTVSRTEKRDYAAQIRRVFSEDGCTRYLIEVTDKDLLSATGGIVQGMSGSPILQNGKLIGAVTHVLLDDPTMGYGVSIDTMLAAAQQIQNAA